MFSKKKPSLFILIISTIGIVYGDIGTSPLYALKSCFAISGLTVNSVNVFGLISVFTWTLFLIVSIKYVMIVMKASHHGEGGILALSALCDGLKKKSIRYFTPALLGILGAALFFSDGVITPAISILSALEGLHLISPHLSDHVMPLAVGTLLALFLIQKRGSSVLGQFFGPIMTIWFITLAVLGAKQITHAPSIIWALNPYYAFQFLYESGPASFIALGGAILVVTGAEALYADMGHFGAKPIKLSWNFIIFPSLLLNYLGQGALLLHNPSAISNPFYLMAPDIALYPLIILATAATIIASQSVISGVFSIAWQGIMLNYLPRLKVIHTSYHQIGQVYVPAINYFLCALTITSVIIFQTSDNLAVAYGLSIASVMLLTTILVFLVAYSEWQWSILKLSLLFIPLLSLDLLFVTSNLIKIIEGAWFTVLITLIVTYTIMIWRRGNRALNRQKFIPNEVLSTYLNAHKKEFPHKIPGTAIFMTRSPDKVPNSLAFHLKHNRFLHQKVIFLSILTTNLPRVATANKYSYSRISTHTFSITTKYGFKEVPNLSKILSWAQEQDLIQDTKNVSFFFSRGVPMTQEKNAIKLFGNRLYIFLCRNAIPAYDFYKIPHDKVIELGIRYEV